MNFIPLIMIDLALLACIGGMLFLASTLLSILGTALFTSLLLFYEDQTYIAANKEGVKIS